MTYIQDENLLSALTIFDRHHLYALDTLQVLDSHNDIQRYYTFTAEINHVSPLSILLSDISFITLICGQSTITVEGIIIALCKNTFITGGRGLGKSTVMYLQRIRISQLSCGIRTQYEKSKKRSPLTNGYIRIACKEHNLHIPTVIVHICNQMYCINSDEEILAFRHFGFTDEYWIQIDYEAFTPKQNKNQAFNNTAFHPYFVISSQFTLPTASSTNKWTQIQITDLDMQFTKRLCITDLINQNRSLQIAGCDQEVVHLLREMPALAQKSLVCSIPTHGVDVDKLVYDHDDREGPLQRHRDLSFWNYLMLNSTALANISISFPNVSEVTSHGLRKQINQLTELSGLQFGTEYSQAFHSKVITVAFALAVRKRMLQIKNPTGNFTWDLNIEKTLIVTAHKLVQIFEEWMYYLIRNNNYKYGISNQTGRDRMQFRQSIESIRPDFLLKTL